MIEIPEPFARKGIEDESWQTWIAALPALVDELLERWSCAPDGDVRHGEVGIVVPVRGHDLPPGVIKVSYPRWANAHEADAYAAWNGRGAVRVHARDDARCALLLERAEYRTLASVTDDEEAVTIQGALSRRLAVEAPPGLPRLADETERWSRDIRADADFFGNPLPRRVIDAALDTVRELGPAQPALLVHGDLHDANILAADREPWLAIDPKVHVGDPAHNALNALRSPRYTELMLSPDPKPRARHLLARYSDAAGLDTDHVRRWLQVGLVRESFWGRRHGDPAWLVDATDRLAVALT